MPKKPRLYDQSSGKTTLTFGKKNEQATLILQCECGRMKPFTVFSLVGTVEMKKTPINSGTQFIAEYGNTVVTVGTSYLQWHCLHEDEQ